MAMYHGTDPLEIEVRPDLAEVMRKQPSYDLGNATAMNVLLDRAQGFVLDTPFYAAHANRLLERAAPAEALEVALAGLSADVADLRAAYAR